MISKFKILYGGKCFHPEKSVKKGGSFKKMEFPSLFFYLELESGIKILFDTGYSSTFFNATKKFPFNIYKHITKVELDNKSIENNLKDINVEIEDIDYIFISHFHPDHIGNLKAFANAKYICNSNSYLSIKDTKGFKALKLGFLKEHLPNDFEERLIFYDKEFSKSNNKNLLDFESKFKLFDEEIFAVELNGHHPGHSGIFFKYKDNYIFLIADSVWRKEEFDNLEFLPKIAKLVFTSYSDYKKTVININKLKNRLENIIIIPTHCNKVYSEVKKNVDFF